METKERLCWLTLGIVVFACVIAVQVRQREVIEHLTQEQAALVGVYESLQAEVGKVRAECSSVWYLDADVRRLKDQMGKVEYQMDIVTAASRSGWDDAHRLIRSGVLE